MPFPVVNPLLTGCQLSPLSVERITPTGPPRGSPPAKIYPLALMASERNVASGTPVLSPVQLSSLSVERKGSTAKRSGKDVTTDIYRQCSDVGVCQTIIDKSPVVAVIGGAINTAALKCT